MRGIVKLSAALKNTASSGESVSPLPNQNPKRAYSSHYRKAQSSGLRCEVAVIQVMKHNHWELAYQRAKTEVAEIDLMFGKENKIALIEVKSLNNSWRAFDRISDSQVQKLKANQLFLANSFKEFKFFASLCWVDGRGKVYFVEIS